MSNEKNIIEGKDYSNLVAKCVDFHDDVDKSEYRRQKIDDIKESHRIYKMIEKPTDFPWEGAFSVVLPFLTISVDNLAPRLYAGFSGKQPYVQFKPIGVTEPDEISIFLEEWYNNELNQVIKIENKVTKIVQTLLLEGTVYPIATYNEDYEEREEYVFGEMEGGLVEVDEEGEPLTKIVNDRIFSGGKIEFASFNDIFIEDNIEDWEKADIIRIVRPTYGELKLLQQDDDTYINIDEELLKEEDIQVEGNPSQEINNIQFNNEIIECYEYHVNYVYQKESENKEDIKDWTTERMIALIAVQSETIIRLIPLKKLNMQNQHVIKRIRLYPEVEESYGCSMYEKMKTLQNGASDSYNLLMNVSYISMLPFFFYSNKAGLPEDLVLSPGVGIEVDDPKDIVFPHFSINPSQFIPIFQIWTTLFEKLSSVGDLQVGRPTSQANTATETMAVISEGNMKHNYQTKVMKDEFISLLKTVYDLYYKSMPFGKTFFYHNEEVRVPRDKMKRAYKFRLTGSTELSNTVLELRKAEQLYGMLRKDPIANPVQLLEDIVTKFNPDADPKQYIDPEISQVIEQHQQQKEMQAQQESQGGGPGGPGGQAPGGPIPPQGPQGPPMQGPPQGQPMQGPPMQGPIPGGM